PPARRPRARSPARLTPSPDDPESPERAVDDVVDARPADERLVARAGDGNRMGHLRPGRTEGEPARRLPAVRLPERVDRTHAASRQLDGEALVVETAGGEGTRRRRAAAAEPVVAAELRAHGRGGLAEPDAGERPAGDEGRCDGN